MGLVESVLLYFLIGLLQDLLITWQAIAIIEKRALWAGFLSVIMTVTAATVWHYLLPSEGLSFWRNGLAYAFGGGVGVWLTIRYKKGRPYVK